MPTLHVYCKDKRFPRSAWMLHLERGGGQLVDPGGQPCAVFHHADAERRFIFPSFWQSIKNLGVVTDHGDVVWFEPRPDNIAHIRTYLGGALAAQGPDAIRAVSRKAWLYIMGGTFLLILAIVGTAVSLAVAFGNSGGGQYIIAIGILAVGGTLLARGLTFLARARSAQGKLEQTE